MKKFLFLAAVLGMTACTSDNYEFPANKGKQKPALITATKEVNLGNGATMVFGKSDIVTKPISTPPEFARATTSVTNVACFGDADHASHDNIEVTEVELPDVDVMGLAKMVCAEFPEYGTKRKENPYNNATHPHPQLSDFTTDFNYVSNGLPIEVMLLYTGTSSLTKLHLYYYDNDGNIHIQRIWEMDDPWMESDEEKTFQKFARINKDNKAWRFTLPQGTEYGFMMQGIASSKGTSGKTEYHYTRMDENLLHPAKNGATPKVNFPSATQFKMETDYEGTFKGQPYTIDASKLQGKTFVTFNNQFGSDTDYDYNDMILMVTPTPDIKDYEKPKIDLEIGDPIEVDFTCQSDDTNIRIHSADIDELIPISKIDNVFGLLLKAGERFSIKIKDLEKLESYWLSDPESDEERLVVDIWLYYDTNSAATYEQVMTLFGIPEGTGLIKEAYSVTHEGSLDQNYSYTVDIALIPAKDSKHSNRIHLSPIFYRKKAVPAED